MGCGRKSVGAGGKPVYVGDALDNLWLEWHQEVTEPESDSEFVEWLVRAKGWGEVKTDNVLHVIETPAFWRQTRLRTVGDVSRQPSVVQHDRRRHGLEKPCPDDYIDEED